MKSREELADLLLRQKRVLILPHKKADGDAIGSAMALALALRQKGVQALIWSCEELPEQLTFLDPAWKELLGEKQSGDFLVALDSADASLLNDRLNEGEIPSLVIDHHRSNLGYARYNWIQKEAAATGEVLCPLLQVMNVEFTEDILRGLYTAIATDTFRFFYESTGIETLKWVQYMMGKGLSISALNHQLFGEKSVASKKLECLCLERSRLEEEGRLIYAVLPMTSQRMAGTSDTNFLVESLRDLRGVEVALLLYETEEGWKASFRSTGIDVGTIAFSLGGGGHRQAAGVSFQEKDPEKLLERILPCLREVLHDGTH